MSLFWFPRTRWRVDLFLISNKTHERVRHLRSFQQQFELEFHAFCRYFYDFCLGVIFEVALIVIFNQRLQILKTHAIIICHSGYTASVLSHCSQKVKCLYLVYHCLPTCRNTPKNGVEPHHRFHSKRYWKYSRISGSDPWIGCHARETCCR